MYDILFHWFQGWRWSSFLARLRAIKPDTTCIPSPRNVINLEHSASTVFVVFFWLVLPFRERKRSIRFTAFSAGFYYIFLSAIGRLSARRRERELEASEERERRQRLYLSFTIVRATGDKAVRLRSKHIIILYLHISHLQDYLIFAKSHLRMYSSNILKFRKFQPKYSHKIYSIYSMIIF